MNKTKLKPNGAFWPQSIKLLFESLIKKSVIMPTTVSKFKKEVYGLNDYIVLVVVSAKKYQETNIALTKYLINEKKIPGVYVTLNKPFEIIQRTLKKGGIDTRLILFIDGISKSSSGLTQRVENCLYVGSPERLSDMSVAIEEAINALPQKDKFLFFDSLSTLLIYNQTGTVVKFGHYLTNKMRDWKLKGILISLHKESDEALINEITQFCDLRLDING